MSKRQRLTPKLLALVAAAGLAIVVSAPRASAFSNASYAGRYVCNVTSNDPNGPQFFTAIMKINPDGNGGYARGVFIAAASGINGVSYNSNLTGNFCSYTLDTSPASNYSFKGNGAGVEVLSWKPEAGNNPGCPGSFVMSDTILLSAFSSATNTSSNTQITSNNLMNDGVAGQGYCEQ